MFIEATELENGGEFESDVCVVGGGAAGIAMALALAERGLSVDLLESGGFDFEAKVQELCRGTNIGAKYPLGWSRLRYLGGSTNHWGGQCHRFSEMDFEPLPWVPDSGWPIRKADVDPYYDRALGILDIAPGFERFADLQKDLEDYPRLIGEDNGAFEPIAWIKSPPTRMGKKFHKALEANRRIRCFTHANGAQLAVDSEGRTVRSLEARSFGGRSLTFRARHYVLSGGSIENARLLLSSDSVVSGGLGNEHDLVGRYFAEHAGDAFLGRMVLVVPPGKKGFQEEYLQQRAKSPELPISSFHFGFGATPALRKKHSMMGFSINPHRVADPKPGSPEAEMAALLAARASSDAGPANTQSYRMWIIAEAVPNRDNRVTLGTETDALGLRKIVLNWRSHRAEAENMLKGVRLFAKELARTGYGRIRVPEFDDFQLMNNVQVAGHQMGTTRMSDDPRKGVTNADGRVHGIDNLYVAGSSLFPTFSYVNPTLTLVALALRTAEHLASLTRP